MWDILGIKGLLLAFLIFAPIERLLAMHQGQKIMRPAWGLDLFYALFNSLITKAGLLGVIATATFLIARLVPEAISNWVASQSLWLQVPAAIVISDIGFYVVHRLFHKVPWLWKFHAVHHSIETLDWLAGHRVHPVDQILTKGASLILVFALGFSDAAIAIYAAIYYWQSLLLHSNVNLEFGPLRWIVASPQFHHWHHANHIEAIDKNFAGQIAALDFLLGSAHLPGKSIPERYGTQTPVPRDYVNQMLFPLRPEPTRTESEIGVRVDPP